MQNLKRMMKVCDGFGDSPKPMVRISNRFLVNSGFLTGNKIEVRYQDGKIIITRIEPSDDSNTRLAVQR